MQTLLNKINGLKENKKKGWLSIEYVIALSIIVIFLIAIYINTFPEHVRNVTDVARVSMNKVLNANEDNGQFIGNGGFHGDFSDGIVSTVYPKEDKWDEVTDFTYTTNASGVTITGYTGTGTKVIIPATIDGQPIIKISASAFASKGLTSVRIPSTVTEIGANAFKNNALESFVAPSSLTTIGDAAFANNKIAAVSFNAKLERIGAEAFKSNYISYVDTRNIITLGANSFHSNTLANILIGSSLANLGQGSFLNQGGLESGNAGVVEIKGEETRFNSIWSSTFDDKFYGYKPQ